MRVVAGRYGGRTLRAPRGHEVRPTADRVREALFSILGPLEGMTVLDLFAGTGALGIEALSRGAAWVTFVDDDRRAQALIAENLAHCGIENLCAIIRAQVARALEALHADPASEPFDIVLLDPPYAPERRVNLDAILRAAGDILARNGVVVLEHARRAAVPETAGDLARRRTVDSGDSALSFYERS